MTTLFISYAREDAQYAEIIRQALESQGYQCWRLPAYPTSTDHSYPYMIEVAILGSAALVLIWSAQAAQSTWIRRHILFAQRLKKKILAVELDDTAFPNTLIAPMTISGRVSCDQAAMQLLPHLSPPDSQETLLALAEKASHEFISNRKAAIDLAADMLAHNEHREEVLAILEYLAQHDLMTGVREKAQQVLTSDQQKATLAAPPPLPLEESRHAFGVRCQKCGQVTYFDKRRVCTAKQGTVHRITQQVGKDLDEMELPCKHCPHILLVHVDCEGY
jgi:TIR domain